jgi:hypothetical protein
MACGPSSIRFLTQRVGVSQTTHGPAIDQTSLYAARRFGGNAHYRGRIAIAKGALRLADREMGLAFAEAVSEAQLHPAVLSAEAKQIQVRFQNAEKSLDGDTAPVDQLTAALAKATGAHPAAVKRVMGTSNPLLAFKHWLIFGSSNAGR